MMPGAFLIELDRLLRDLTESTDLFAGKIIILSGDMRQTLPVMPGKTDIEVLFLRYLKNICIVLV
jgi:hypothetical protein